MFVAIMSHNLYRFGIISMKIIIRCNANTSLAAYWLSL